jgi:hypothetical protein
MITLKCNGCINQKVCLILGDCIFCHEIASDPQAREELKTGKGQKGIKHILSIFGHYTRRRMIFSNGRGKPTIINPVPEHIKHLDKKRAIEAARKIFNQ